MNYFNFYNNKRVLITGNTGFKGSWLSLWLTMLGADVYGYSKDIPTEPSLYKAVGPDKTIHQTFADVRDLKTLSGVIAQVKPDYIFHLAAQPIVSKSYKEPVETITSNVIGTMNVLESLRQLNQPCVAVIITSDKCYDNVEWVWGYKETDSLGGKDIYSGSKGAAEMVFKSYYHSFFSKLDCPVRLATARAGNVIGGGDWALDRIIPDAMRAWSEHKPVEIRSPQSTRPWQHVLEPLSGYLTLGAALSEKRELNGQSFNFGPNAQYNHTVSDILNELAACWHIEKPENAYKAAVQSSFQEASLRKLNCDKALFYLKWIAALRYDELIKFTGDWYYNYYKGNDDMLEYTKGQINSYTNLAKERGIEWAQ
jgi:CDP-glucose 4,6-dehydratase